MADDKACKALSSDARAFALLQRDLAPKAELKLPGWALKKCLFTRRALEQCSSEALAHYKATRYSGVHCIDLSGGLGVDAVAFARSFEEVTSIDPDEDLHLLFMHNVKQLGLRNIHRIQGDALSVLQGLQSRADLIFLDPDRRDKQGGKRLVGFQHYQPNPLELYRLFGHLGRRWLMKFSPLDDIKAIMDAFTGLKSISVLSKDAEVKELLLELIPEYSGTTEIAAVFIGQGSSDTYSFHLGGSSWFQGNQSSAEPLQWLYEPASALIKSAYLKNSKHRMQALNASGTLWTSVQRADLPGRWVKISVVKKDFSLRKMSRFLQDQGIQSGLVKTRDFPIGSEQARTLLGIAEGEDYAIYLTKTGNTALMIMGEISRDSGKEH